LITRFKHIIRERLLRSDQQLSQLGLLGQQCMISPLAKFQGNLANIFIEDGVRIGDHVLIQAHSQGGMIRIGPRTLLKQFAQIMSYPGGSIEFGADSSVNPFCMLYGHGGLSIGSKVRIAAHTVIIPANHKFDRLDAAITAQGLDRKGIRIEDDVWIGANCTICDGVTVGTGSIIGAGSVVTRDIPPMSVAMGAPARAIKKRAGSEEVLES
jgi:acetyltransferase-like isoleucine patch superfamily enzyme